MRQFLKPAALAAIFALAFSGCSDKINDEYAPDSKAADLVVYGTVYTVEEGAPQAEALAVKDGKYVYVGDVDGAKAFVGAKTNIIDHRGKGMITPGFADCHSHYLMAEAMNSMGSLQFDIATVPQQLLVNVALAYQDAKAKGKPAIYGFGWTYQLFEEFGMPTLEELDAVCPDLPMYLSDGEGHKGLANSVCLRKAGFIDEKGDRTDLNIKGGEIVVDKNGKATGLLKEQAGTYCKLHSIDFNLLLDNDKAIDAVSNARDALHSKGYVSYLCGWANYYGNLRFYEAAKALDANNNLDLNLGLAYEIESSSKDPLAEVEKAAQTKSFRTAHINPNYIKMFVDGTVETETGFVSIPYLNKDKGVGEPNWSPEDFAKITTKANANDITMHVHAMGDAGVHLAVDAFVASGKKEMRNTLVHVRNVLDQDYKIMADNGIVVTSGFLWHMSSAQTLDIFRKTLPEKYVTEMYPIKSYFDNGVIMSAHSDFPALSGSSEKPFYMIEIACTGVMPESGDKPYWPSELINRQQALKAMTINGAYQMHSEKDRGSIKVGKFADFVIANKDVMNESCPANQIHTAQVTHTFFEGKQVFPKK